jgi:tetratricopeptide (TPR) repeat protein
MRAFRARIGVLLCVAALAVTTVSACVDKPTEHRVRANAYLRNGDAQKALEEIERGLALEDKSLSLLVLKGKALFELERYEEAKAAYELAMSIGAASPEQLGEAHLGLAMIGMRGKDWPAARKSFEALVGLNAKDGDARINLARICLQMEDLPCALEHGEEAGHLRGRSEDVLFTLGRIYVAAKRFDEAEKTFNHICEVTPNAASCPYGVALVAAQKGDSEKALAKLKEAVDKKLPNPDKLAEDPMLAPLKDAPGFAELVAAAKGS